MSAEGFSIDRRKAVTGLGVAAVTVAVGGAIASRSSAASAAPPGATPAGPADCPTANPTEIAKTKDVPVGGGVILGDIVLTQPKAGEFRAFCATCTHLGCHLSTVSDGTVNCRCHGSKFHLDGTVARGPAMDSLLARTVRVQGDAVILEPFVQGLPIPCLPSIPPEQFPDF
jgi:Rieske Fe-S protein